MSVPRSVTAPALLACAAALCLAGCSSVPGINDRAILAQSNGKAPTATQPLDWIAPPKTEYRLGPRDLLEIEVYELEQPNETKQIKTRVSQQGDIVIPLIGSVRATGLTVAELQTEIEKRLAEDYLVNPSVNVLVAEYQARRVTVLGAVQKPGTFALQENSTTLIDALAVAGGATEEADTTVYVVRAAGPQPASQSGQAGAAVNADAPAPPGAAPVATPKRVLKVDLTNLIEHGDLSANCSLQDGDVVHVPPVRHFFVSGEVRQPGSFPLRGDITVLNAIAMAGGLKDNASPSATLLIRKAEDGSRKTIPIDLTEVEAQSDGDLALEPDDVLIVSETGGSKLLRGVGSVLQGLFTVGYSMN